MCLISMRHRGPVVSHDKVCEKCVKVLKLAASWRTESEQTS